jgi:hypothetical protein
VAWCQSKPTCHQNKKANDFTDIVRLVEAHTWLWASRTPQLRQLVKPPAG